MRRRLGSTAAALASAAREEPAAAAVPAAADVRGRAVLASAADTEPAQRSGTAAGRAGAPAWRSPSPGARRDKRVRQSAVSEAQSRQQKEKTLTAIENADEQNTG